MIAMEPLELVPTPHVCARDPYCVYLNSLSSSESRRAMRRCLNRITFLYLADAGRPEGLEAPAVMLDHPKDLAGVGMSRAWWALRYTDTARIRALLLEYNLPPSTFNQHMTALRKTLKECWRLELMSGDDYQRAADLEGVRGSRLPAGRSIHADELAAILGACVDMDSPAAIDIRDAALLAFLYSTGCRREEAASALIEQYDPGGRVLRVIGKGNKQRDVFMTPAAVPHLDRWLVLLGERRGAMFRPLDKWGNIHARHMCPRAIGRIVGKCRVRASLQPLSAHDFRKTFAGDFLDAGGDLAQLQMALGHASPTTSAGYDRRPGRAIRAVVDKLTMPSPADLAARDDG